MQVMRRSHGRLLTRVMLAVPACIALQGLDWVWSAGPAALIQVAGQAEGGESTEGEDPRISELRDHIVELAGELEHTQVHVLFEVLVVCFVVAKTQPPPTRPPEVAAPLQNRADFNIVLIFATFLSFLAGMVNVVGIIELGLPVGHHTGTASHIGRLIGEGCMKFVLALVFFVFGSYMAGYFQCDGETLFQGRFSPGLLSGACAIAGGTLIQAIYAKPFLAVPLFAFSQGIQNAITRNFIALPVCTTHVTGYLTDIGTILGEWLRAKLSGGREPVPSLRLVFFMFMSVFAFGLGALFSKKCCDRVGHLSGLLPAALMAVTSLGIIPLPKPRTDTKKS